MSLRPSLEAKDIEQLTHDLFRIIDNKHSKVIQPITDQLRRLNVVDNIHPEETRKQLKKRKELLYQCHLFIKQNNV